MLMGGEMEEWVRDGGASLGSLHSGCQHSEVLWVSGRRHLAGSERGALAGSQRVGEIIDGLVGDGVESGLGGAVKVKTPGDRSTWGLF